MTGNLTDEEDESYPTPNNAAVRAKQELTSKWQVRAKPTVEGSVSQLGVRNPFLGQSQSSNGGSETSEEEHGGGGNTVDELSNKWNARSQRDDSQARRRVAGAGATTHKNTSGQNHVHDAPTMQAKSSTFPREDPPYSKHPSPLATINSLPSPSPLTTVSSLAPRNPTKSYTGSQFLTASQSQVTTAPPPHLVGASPPRPRPDPISFLTLPQSTPVPRSLPSPLQPIHEQLQSQTNGNSAYRGAYSGLQFPALPGLQTSNPLKRTANGDFKLQNGIPPISGKTAPPHTPALHGAQVLQIKQTTQPTRASLVENRAYPQRIADSNGSLPNAASNLNGIPTTTSHKTATIGNPPISACNSSIKWVPPAGRPYPLTTNQQAVSDKSFAEKRHEAYSSNVELSNAPMDLAASTKISRLIVDATKATLEADTNTTTEERRRLEFLVKKTQQTNNTSGQPFSPEEDELIVFLKERANLRWPQIHEYFPGRTTWHSIQSRYSHKLHARVRESPESDARRSPSQDSDVPRKARRSTRLLHNVHTEAEDLFSHEVSHLENHEFMVLEDSSEDENHALFMSEARRLSKAATSRLILESASSHTTARALPRRSLLDHSVPQSNGISGVPGVGSCRSERLRGPQLVDRNLVTSEKLRDGASLGSLTMRISRQPTSENQSLPNGQQRVMKRKRRSIDVQRPYLDLSERQYLARTTTFGFWDTNEMIDWDGKILHVDFLDEEVRALEQSICTVRRAEGRPGTSLRQWAVQAMKNASEEQISKISRDVQDRDVFLNRTKSSIDCFLRDLSNSSSNDIPSVQRLDLKPQVRPSSYVSVLRNREIGDRCLSGLEFRHSTSANLRSLVYDTLGPHLSMIGASGDVTNVAWSPNGEIFAAGCAALTDEHSMQYNHRNNLLLGDITTKTIRELPEHAEARKKTSSGANATREMHVSQDSLLFSSISAVQFSPDGSAMFSAGYDKVARVWDVRKDRGSTNSINDAGCVLEFQHRASIDLLAVNASRLFATGSQRNTSSIKVLKYDLDATKPHALKVLSLSSPRAQQRPDCDIIPSCMRWGYNFYQQQKYLLCGFTSRAKDYGDGEICIWDVEAGQTTAIARGSRNVFDAAWSPSIFGRFAVASTPASNKEVNRGTNSVIRIFDSRLMRSTSLVVDTMRTIEMECPALDVNDVVFNPMDDFLISAGCTDAVTYIWDIRNPDYLLHEFAHDLSLNPLDETHPYEETDTGIRFVSWDQTRRNLYTASSDGVVSLWNTYVAAPDAHIRDVVQLNSGIMSGAFSPDFSNLLLGEVNGSVSLLSVGNQDKTPKDFEPFTLQRADEEMLDKVRRRVGAQTTSSSSAGTNPHTIGTDTARTLLSTGELELRPFGGLPIRQAVQGPRYAGPFDTAPDAFTLRAKAIAFQAKMRPSEAPCTLHHDEAKITEEERGDSRAWVERIPERLRTSGKLDASHTELDLMCFRCHDAPLMTSVAVVDSVFCMVCRAMWRVDVLGYTPLAWDTQTPFRSFEIANPAQVVMEASKSGQEDQGGDEGNDDEDAKLGDVEAWHHSFWRDKSPSPL